MSDQEIDGDAPIDGDIDGGGPGPAALRPPRRNAGRRRRPTEIHGPATLYIVLGREGAWWHAESQSLLPPEHLLRDGQCRFVGIGIGAWELTLATGPFTGDAPMDKRLRRAAARRLHKQAVAYLLFHFDYRAAAVLDAESPIVHDPSLRVLLGTIGGVMVAACEQMQVPLRLFLEANALEWGSIIPVFLTPAWRGT